MNDRAPRSDVSRNLPIDDRVIRAYLRGAVVANILRGWYPYMRGPNDPRWVINRVSPPGTETMDRQRVEEYVEALWFDGVEPRWRS